MLCSPRATLMHHMPEYRAYLVGSDDHIQNVVHLNCADDDQAIILAKAFVDGHDIELWQRDRKVARFPKVLKKG
jgi:hypothetical protein